MNISYNWLKEYIDIDIEAVELGKILTNLGLEVEAIEEYQSIKGGLKGFVVGEVLTCEKHPNADKLSKTTVNTGSGAPLDIVCGAPNVAAGQKVIVATIGANVSNGNESFVINKTKIRGEISEGMICAEDEIGLGTSHDGILVLDPTAKPGTPAEKYFNLVHDTVFVIGLTPNRIDSGSHIGVARDLAAFLKQKKEISYRWPSIESFKVENKNYPVNVSIENKEACNRYSGVTVTGVKIGPSPKWMQDRLKAIGLNPINNIVDITNYVLHETGQPLHAFDADKLNGKKIIVRQLPKGTKFVTLEGKERELSDEDLMICDAKGPVCIAGVLGGLHSGVTEKTTNVFIESAYFNPVFVRRTAKRHMINTDSSFRFERGTDGNNTLYAAKRAAILMKELAGGTIASDMQDEYPVKINNHVINVSFKNIARLIGAKLSNQLISKILTALEIKIISADSEGYKLEVPSYRVDVKREADVIEEILRIYGYNTVEISNEVKSTLSYINKPDTEKLINQISEFLVFNGFYEIWCNSLTKESYHISTGLFETNSLVKIHNPLSTDLSVMRQSLLFGGLETMVFNLNRQQQNVKLFEFGNCYFQLSNDEKLSVDKRFREDMHVSLLISGQKEEQGWSEPPQAVSFYMLKSFIERILKLLKLDAFSYEISETANAFFEFSVSYFANKNKVLEYGKVSKKMLNEFDIKKDVFAAELNWTNLVALIPNEATTFKELPKYPEVRRDLSMILDQNIKFEDINKAAFKAEKKLLKQVHLFDVFISDKIEKGKKSYAVSFVLQDEEKTLTDKQIEKTMESIQHQIEKDLGAKIRQ